MENPIRLIEAHQQRVDKMNGEIELPPNGTSLDLLRAVYRNSSLPLPTRMRAAGLALPHEHPRLSVVAQVNEQDFASLLEARIKNYERITNGTVERSGQPVPQIEARPIKPHVIDRRYRRV